MMISLFKQKYKRRDAINEKKKSEWVWSFHLQTVYRYHHKGKSTWKHLHPQVQQWVPPKIANLQQLAITVKEVPNLSFFGHHIAMLELKSSSQCKYKNDQSQGFMDIFC